MRQLTGILRRWQVLLYISVAVGSLALVISVAHTDRHRKPASTSRAAQVLDSGALPTEAMRGIPDRASEQEAKSAQVQTILHAAPQKRLGPNEVGSEGYGPWVLRALDSQKPQLAFEAAGVLSRCAGALSALEVAHRFKNSSAKGSGRAVEMLVRSEEAEARACQTITDEHHALRARLLEMAAKGKVAGAAARYLDAASKEAMAEALALARDAANGGDLAALNALSLRGIKYGTTNIEQRAYFLALNKMLEAGAHPERQLSREQFSLLFNVQLSEQHEAAANTMADQISARCLANSSGDCGSWPSP